MQFRPMHGRCGGCCRTTLLHAAFQQGNAWLIYSSMVDLSEIQLTGAWVASTVDAWQDDMQDRFTDCKLTAWLELWAQRHVQTYASGSLLDRSCCNWYICCLLAMAMSTRQLDQISEQMLHQFSCEVNWLGFLLCLGPHSVSGRAPAGWIDVTCGSNRLVQVAKRKACFRKAAKVYLHFLDAFKSHWLQWQYLGFAQNLCELSFLWDNKASFGQNFLKLLWRWHWEHNQGRCQYMRSDINCKTHSNWCS